MARYVAYYRSRSGPGKSKDSALQAQRESVIAYVNGRGELVNEFTEDEGRDQKRKPHLEHALKAARRKHAVLIIPRFKAILGDIAFMALLKNTDVDILGLDMSEVDYLAVEALAATAEHKRELLSLHIKAALRRTKARGTRLGNPAIADAQKQGAAAASRAATDRRRVLLAEVQQLRGKGFSLRAIADDLNRRDIPTPRGRIWHASSVRNILAGSQAGLGG